MTTTPARAVAGPPADAPAAGRPWHLVVLALAAVAGLLILHAAAGDWRQASAGGEFPSDLRQGALFAVLFNAGLGAALVVVALIEVLAASVRAARARSLSGAQLPRALAAVALPVAFAAAHALWNPWTLEVARVAWGALR